MIQDAQYNLHLISNDKRTAFINWLSSFDSTGFKEVSLSPKRHYSIACKEYDSGKYFMKFAKQKGKTVNKKVNNDFVSTMIDDYPHCKIFIDPARNIMIIEKNSDIGDTILKIKKIVEEVISKDIQNYGYSIDIELVTRATDFWNYVNDNCDKLKSIEFTFVYPNFLRGFSSVTEFIKGFDIYNPDSITTKIENKNGNLQLSRNRDFINDALGYSSSGAGKWKISAQGSTTMKSSEETPITRNLSADLSVLTHEQILEIAEVFDTVENIIKENKNETYDENNN